ncbi:ABC transporter permease [Nitratireductor pacificus]|uniref:Binding-protein-dependent transporter inner membrane component n=1 Tax=Nitratireductor pacificus pht-3B TaxID=391937 RepID=K2MIB8_9HYPH|nr:ABC transporter permease subunit [Nitratireductor pacificus]EKF20455.1 binding-protein-dependent transporter inner membrane component [Nitratireductor pacificus pht-3B]
MKSNAPARQAGARGHRLAALLTDTFWGRLTLRATALAIVLIAWQMAGDDSVALLFPTATRTFQAFIELMADGRLPLGLLVTGQALLAGFAIIIGIGVPLGILIARFPLVDRTVSPYFTFLVAVPIIAIVPVVQALLGLTFAARVTVIVLFGISYVVINSAIAVRRVKPELIEMAASFGARRLAILTQVVLPAAVPGIMTGARLALGQALIGMVVAELTIVGAGVGSLIAELQGRFKVAAVLAVAMTIVLIGLCLLSLVEMLERRLNRWSLTK